MRFNVTTIRGEVLLAGIEMDAIPDVRDSIIIKNENTVRTCVVLNRDWRVTITQEDEKQTGTVIVNIVVSVIHKVEENE